MSAGTVILLIVLGGITLVWASRHLMISRERRTGFVLTPPCPGPPEAAPKISVVVAAKDEAANIETCLRTMLDQDYPDFEIVACNDRSDDETGAIIDRLAAEHSRLRAVHITELPDGWCGKNNAMQHGIRAATGEWICMIDADCRQLCDRTLSVAMQYAEDTAADLLSVLPILEMKGFWEYVIQPVCSGVMMIWFHPDKVNSPNKPNAYANGAFMLIRRSAYEQLGAHEAVKDRVNEDMHMAALVKREGLNLRVVRSRGLYLVRMYTSLREIVRGWTRIFFGTFGTAARLSVSLAVVTIMGVLPYLTLIAGVGAATATGQLGWWLVTILSAAAVGLQVSVIYRFYALAGGKRALAWTYLLGCLVTMLCLGGALTKLRPGSRLQWRGTSYAPPGSS